MTMSTAQQKKDKPPKMEEHRMLPISKCDWISFVCALFIVSHCELAAYSTHHTQNNYLPRISIKNRLGTTQPTAQPPNRNNSIPTFDRQQNIWFVKELRKEV